MNVPEISLFSFQEYEIMSFHDVFKILDVTSKAFGENWWKGTLHHSRFGSLLNEHGIDQKTRLFQFKFSCKKVVISTTFRGFIIHHLEDPALLGSPSCSNTLMKPPELVTNFKNMWMWHHTLAAHADKQAWGLKQCSKLFWYFQIDIISFFFFWIPIETFSETFVSS